MGEAGVELCSQDEYIYYDDCVCGNAVFGRRRCRGRKIRRRATTTTLIIVIIIKNNIYIGTLAFQEYRSIHWENDATVISCYYYYYYYHQDYDMTTLINNSKTRRLLYNPTDDDTTPERADYDYYSNDNHNNFVEYYDK